MKILYLSQRLPYPPNRGDRIPTFNHIRFLSRSHKVYAASLLESKAEEEFVVKLQDWAESVTVEMQSRAWRAWGMTLAFLTGRPLSLGHFYNSRFHRRVRDLIEAEGIEAVVVFSSSMAQYVEDMPGLPRVMNFCDMDSQKWEDLASHTGGLKGWIYRREARLLLEYERFVAKSFSSSCVVTENEADLFRRLIPGAKVSVVANGVESERFAERGRKPAACELTFVGVMDYGPNIEAVTFFVESVWPEIRKRHPEARFDIVGARPTREVKALADTAGVRVTGFVPDVRDYLSTSTLVVVPLKIARGIQNKILEAMAAGAPVLTTPVASQGLAEGARHTLFIEPRDNPSVFAAAVLRLLADPAALRERADKAQAYVREHYSWEANVDILEDMLLESKAGAAALAPIAPADISLPSRIKEASGVSDSAPSAPAARSPEEPPV